MNVQPKDDQIKSVCSIKEIVIKKNNLNAKMYVGINKWIKCTHLIVSNFFQS